MKRRNFLLAALLTACTTAPTTRTPGDALDDGERLDDTEPDQPAPKTTPDDVASVARSTNRFAMAMYAALAKDGGNMAFSPASISLALNMTRAGARGQTASQMKSALEVSLDDDRAHAAYGNLLHRWNHGKRPYELAVANRLFGEKTMAFKAPFLGLTKDEYGAELEKLSFKTDPEGARQAINEWVEGRTRERIRDLLPADSIKQKTRLVLTNAVYFKGKWKVEFAEKDTRESVFHAPGGDVQVPMMNLTATFDYAAADGMQMVEMPYAGDDLAMTILVPDAMNLDALTSSLSEEALSRWQSQAVKEEVIVAMPRFKIDPKQSVKLKPLLQGLGMTDAFDEARADFSDLAEIDPGERLVVDNAYHKAFVEVNEAGTEAAAATAVVINTEAAAAPTEKRVIADRPFLFLIRDKKSGAIMFMGRVENPSS